MNRLNPETIRLWDVATRQQAEKLQGHGSEVLSVAFSADGQTLASGSKGVFFDCGSWGKAICSLLMSVSQGQERIRCFIAIPVDAAVLGIVHQLQCSLGDRLASDIVQWTPPAQIHLTLKFLGNVLASSLEDLITALRQACQGAGPFKLRLDNLGCFPNSRAPRIVWTGLAGDLGALLALQGRIAQRMTAFSAHDDSHAFHPHLSIGRVKRAHQEMAGLLGKVIAEAGNPEPAEWTVGQVELIRSVLGSQGSTYSNLAVVSLAHR